MIKKLIRGIGIMTVCLFLFPSSVLAAEKSVTLTKVDDGVQAFVELPSEETTDSVNALQMEFKVETIKGKSAKAEFDFNKAIKSSVKECRYDKNTGRLTIYIAGKTDLFSEELLSDGKLELGKVVVSTEDALGVKAKISVAKDEYFYVTGNGTKLEKESINAQGFVEVVVGKGGVEDQTPTPDPDEEEKPTPNPDDEETSDSEIPPQEDENGNEDGNQNSEQNTKPNQGQDVGDDEGKAENQSQDELVKTGDEMQPMVYLLMAVIAAITVVGLLLFRRKKNKDSEK